MEEPHLNVPAATPVGTDTNQEATAIAIPDTTIVEPTSVLLATIPATPAQEPAPPAPPASAPT